MAGSRTIAHTFDLRFHLGPVKANAQRSAWRGRGGQGVIPDARYLNVPDERTHLTSGRIDSYKAANQKMGERCESPSLMLIETSLSRQRAVWVQSGKRPLTLRNLDKTLWPAGTGKVYAIMSPSCKWYIGQTRQALRERWKQHAHPCRIEGGCRLIARAFAKYGANRMELWVLDDNVPLCDLNERERERIAEHGTFDPNGWGYNLTPGGDSSPMHVPEVAERSSATHTEQWKDPEHRAKMSKARKESKLVSDHCERMRSMRKFLDYWDMSRADALRKLKAARLSAKQRAERYGVEFDPENYDVQIRTHMARHMEDLYEMDPMKALKVIIGRKKSMVRWWQTKGMPFENEWWYDDQIRAHQGRTS